MFCSSRSLFFINSARALLESASLFSSSRMLSCSSFTCIVRCWCGSSLHSSTSGRRSRFFRRDWATFNGGWMLPTEIFNRSIHFSMSLLSWNRNRHMGAWQLIKCMKLSLCILYFVFLGTVINSLVKKQMAEQRRWRFKEIDNPDWNSKAIIMLYSTNCL